jgi:hypothetical protein
LSVDQWQISGGAYLTILPLEKLRLIEGTFGRDSIARQNLALLRTVCRAQPILWAQKLKPKHSRLDECVSCNEKIVDDRSNRC